MNVKNKNGQVVDLFNIPEYTVIDESYNIDLNGNAYITSLPKNLHIKGSLILKDSNIKRLGDGLRVGKQLDLSRTRKLEVLSESLEVQEDLILDQSGLKNLPKNMKVKNLSMKETEISEIPIGVRVFGNLDLSKSKTKLVKSFSVPGDLILNHYKLGELPEGLVVGGSLSLRVARIRRFPIYMRVEKNIDLSGTSYLEELPNGFKVKGDLILYKSGIQRLGDNIIIKGDLNINFANNLEELPNGLIVHGTLTMLKTHIQKFGKGIKVKGDLMIDRKLMNLIPDDMTVMGNIIPY